MAWFKQSNNNLGNRRQALLASELAKSSLSVDIDLDTVSSNPISVSSDFDTKASWLIKGWAIDDSQQKFWDYQFEYLCRHSPLLISKSGFGGIAHELYTSNKPVFTIIGLGLGISGNPIATISHNYQQYQVDISPLFIGLSTNKRKRLLKYNKLDNTFNDKVYKFVAKLVNDNLMTFKR